MEEFIQGRASERKWRLIACACSRRIWHFLDDRRSRQAVEATEKFFDGHINPDSYRLAQQEAWQAWCDTAYGPDEDGTINRAYALSFIAANAIVRLTSGAEWDGFLWTREEILHAVQYAFEGQSSAVEKEREAQCQLMRDVLGNPFQPVSLQTTWLTSTVVRLAQTFYEDHAFDRLPILADALEEAGCTDATILGHLRGPGPHVRGCWAVDLLLGKE
jgi:hypothetical protein